MSVNLPTTVLAETELDKELVSAAFKKAKELGHNPIPAYVEKEGGVALS